MIYVYSFSQDSLINLQVILHNSLINLKTNKIIPQLQSLSLVCFSNNN